MSQPSPVRQYNKLNLTRTGRLLTIAFNRPELLNAVNLEMPVGVPPTNLPKPEKVQIDIDAKSVVYWQGVAVTAEELEYKMSQLAQLNPQPEVHLRPNQDCQYAVFANVLSASKRRGLSKMAVIGSEQFVQ